MSSGRQLTTRPSASWKTPVIRFKPAEYDAARESAAARRIDFADIERFVFDDAPGIDTVDCKALQALFGLWCGKPMVARPKSVPADVVAAANNDPKVLYFATFCENRALFSVAEDGDRRAPIFTLQTDLFACYDACYDWWLYRMQKLDGLTKLDNGWHKHGIRLLARFQQFKLFGTQMWWTDERVFLLDEASRSRWHALKRKRAER